MFLLGMAIMTGALRALADEKMRSLLTRAVNSPTKGAVTGAVATALLQSSSATTVAAVGFVGAGLLTFSESLGIIFGANIGTTITGWFVALVGFKLNLGEAMLPLVLFGVLLRMTGRPRFEQWGTAVAGFGLIFVGISNLQTGMSGLQGQVTPSHFPPDTVWGRVLLVLIGMVITFITQSSSAGVATALAAVHTDTISLNQAAAMVIGMNVGTAGTAVLATIGGNAQARRTGFAHLIYNTFTAVGAFLLLTPYMLAVDAIIPGSRSADPELVLVGFHSFFNALGVVAILPFTGRFAALLIRLIPERGNPLARQLDRSMLAEPAAAVAAAGNTLLAITRELLGEVRRQLDDAAAPANSRMIDDIHDAIDQCSGYLEELAARVQGGGPIHDYVAHLHILDHLRRIGIRLREERRLKRCRDDQQLAEMSDAVSAAASVLLATPLPLPPEAIDQIRLHNRELKDAMRAYRVSSFERTTKEGLQTSVALSRIDTARSLRRIAYHIWRICNHLASAEQGQEVPRKEPTGE